MKEHHLEREVLYSAELHSNFRNKHTSVVYIEHGPVRDRELGKMERAGGVKTGSEGWGGEREKGRSLERMRKEWER